MSQQQTNEGDPDLQTAVNSQESVQDSQQGNQKGTGFLNVAKSTIAAACGIQTDANRQRDFEQGKASSFIIAGLVFVIVFVLVMAGIVQLVLHLAS